MQPSVSVIVPTFNRPRELEAAAQSVLAQAGVEVELIVVDDGSEVDLRKSCSSLADPRVRYLRQARQGPGAARNLGLAEAHGRFVAFLDSDDVMLPGNLARLQEQLGRNPRAGAAHGWAVFQGPGGEDIQQGRPKLRGRCFARLLFANLVPMGTVLMRQGCWEAVGGFDPGLPVFEDWDFWLRLSFHSEFDYVPAVVARITAQEARRSTSQPTARIGATVEAIYAKLRRDPAAWPLIRHRARHLRANVHVMTGHHYRVFDRNRPAARREFLRALRIAPDLPRVYTGLLEAFASGSMIERLRQARSRYYGQRGG
ncbi:MAG: glycosyltransferase family 2 protein [Anaerolineales bacterium]|nr:glycosyltransferase family 2 protein [Anaerolineales bacterium]